MTAEVRFWTILGVVVTIISAIIAYMQLIDSHETKSASAVQSPTATPLKVVQVANDINTRPEITSEYPTQFAIINGLDGTGDGVEFMNFNSLRNNLDGTTSVTIVKVYDPNQPRVADYIEYGFVFDCENKLAALRWQSWYHADGKKGLHNENNDELYGIMPNNWARSFKLACLSPEQRINSTGEQKFWSYARSGASPIEITYSIFPHLSQ